MPARVASTITIQSFSFSERTRPSGLTGGAASRRCLAEAVADAVDGADEPRAELAAERADVGVDGALTRAVGVAPDCLEQLLAPVHDARVRGQEQGQLELRRGQVHRPAGARRAVPDGIELDGADDADRRRSLRRLAFAA